MAASNCPDLLFAKGRPAALLRQDVKRQRATLDELESVKVRSRSDGRCEVWEQKATGKYAIAVRCKRRAVHVHHVLNGNGTRARNESALAQNKLHICVRCHSDLHGKVLVPTGAGRYRRLK
jgi:hypothetical protein